MRVVTSPVVHTFAPAPTTQRSAITSSNLADGVSLFPGAPRSLLGGALSSPVSLWSFRRSLAHPFSSSQTLLRRSRQQLGMLGQCDGFVFPLSHTRHRCCWSVKLTLEVPVERSLQGLLWATDRNPPGGLSCPETLPRAASRAVSRALSWGSALGGVGVLPGKLSETPVGSPQAVEFLVEPSSALVSCRTAGVSAGGL